VDPVSTTARNLAYYCSMSKGELSHVAVFIHVEHF
jgi:hypothetical protein